MIKKRHFVKNISAVNHHLTVHSRPPATVTHKKVETLFACLVFSVFMLSSFSSIAQVQPQQHLQQLEYDKIDNDAYSTKE